MLRVTPVCHFHGQFKERLKNRMAGYKPSVDFKKVKGMFVTMRSEANSGHTVPYIKTNEERLETAGKKMARIDVDPAVGRYAVYREAKISQVSLVKANIAPKVPWPLPEGGKK
jgi:hypothetical protein